MVERLFYEGAVAMERLLEEGRQEIRWPRETIVSLEVRENSASAMIDVDLPEAEDMPTKLAAVPSRGMKLP